MKSTRSRLGVMGGSWYDNTGGGSNYLCLSLNPIFDKTTSGSQGNSYIYGTEYEVSGNSNMFSKNLHDHDAPCPQVGLWSTKVILCQHMWGIMVGPSLFVLMRMPKAPLDLTMVKMVHYYILLKVVAVHFLVHHTPLVKKLPALFAPSNTLRN